MQCMAAAEWRSRETQRPCASNRQRQRRAVVALAATHDLAHHVRHQLIHHSAQSPLHGLVLACFALPTLYYTAPWRCDWCHHPPICQGLQGFWRELLAQSLGGQMPFYDFLADDEKKREKMRKRYVAATQRFKHSSFRGNDSLSTNV